MTRPALAVLAAALLASCTPPSGNDDEAIRDEAEMHEPNVREWVGAMEAGMARARLDLARRAIWRQLRFPG